MLYPTHQKMTRIFKMSALTLLASFTLTGISANLSFAQHNAPSAPEISRGQYLSYAADCMACHTENPDKPYAGGHGLESPLGTIYSSNITPDKTHGIGNYSLADFDKAVRAGSSKNHGQLFPAMPFVSYAKMNDEDIEALYQYFMTEVAPIAEPNLGTDIEWPLSMRWPLFFWNTLIADKTPFKPNPEKSDAWNRGAYIIQGPAHCGTCHTPRDITLSEQGMTEASDLYLSGSQLGGWYAPNIRHIKMDDSELFTLLQTGKNTRHAFAGPMADVTSFSLRHLTDDDLNSMITYLRDIALPETPFPKIGVSQADASPGRSLYQVFCSTCHGRSGEGEASVIPSLQDRGNGELGRSLNIANVILFGAETAHREDQVAYRMPAYKEELNDEQIANIVNFIMNNQEWNNHNPLITPQMVDDLKENTPILRGWWVIAAGAVGLLVLLLIFRRFRKGKTKKQ